MAVSIGAANIANGNGAVAIGDPNVATGTGAVAVGADNTATGTGAIAQGNLSVAVGDGSVALGNQSLARGAGSIAMGNAANVFVGATNGVALGSGAVVQSATGVALGSGSVANRGAVTGTAEAISGTPIVSTQAEVSVGAPGAERQITNVAGGTQDTDAVNLRQLRAAQASTVEAVVQNIDAKINNLAQGIQRVEKNANSGTAAAMAMAGMPQSAVPGKGMVSAGAASYGGETAIAVGVSMVSDSGKWVSKLNGSANSRGKFGMSVGVGFQW
jgi:autotransporter adhesin